jgi:polyisoprenoid-binding protein YceI
MSVEASQTGQLPATGTWTVDPVHSTVGFRVKHHAVGTFRGRFAEVAGSYDASAGTLTGSARAASVQVPIDMLRDHLLKEDFFDAEQHPEITFVSTSVTADGGALAVEGDLTLRGVTQRVQATGTISGPSRVAHYDGTVHDHIGMDLELTIDRRDFGVSFNNPLVDGQLNLGWDVGLEFALELSSPVEG